MVPAPAAAAAPVPTRPPTYLSPEFRFRLTLPESWRGRYETSAANDDAAASRRAKAAHIAEFLYLPVDTKVEPPALLQVVGYKASAWPAVRGSALGGDSLGARDGYVFAAVLPRAPFAAGTPDRLSFDSLRAALGAVAPRFELP